MFSAIHYNSFFTDATSFAPDVQLFEKAFLLTLEDWRNKNSMHIFVLIFFCSGLETSSLWNGGMIFGLMKALQPIWKI